MDNKKRKIQTNSSLELKYPKNDIKEKEVPAGVVNPEAWYRWMIMRENKVMKEDYRIRETSDPYLEVDLLTPTGILKKRIAHLPKEEQEHLIKQSAGIRVVQGKITSLKLKAFGIKQKGHYSMSESILDPRTGELIEYFGRFFNIVEVHKIVVEEWGYPVSKDLISRFRKRNLEQIKERQEEYKRDYSDIRLGYKKSRLEELEWIYKIRKDKYGIGSTVGDEKMLLQILKQIKDEVEVDVLRIEGDINHKIETTINIHVQEDLFKSMTINDIIIGRVAAKQGLNAAYLVERLHNSFYNKFSGFGNNERSMKEEDIAYPSSLVYDWKSIEKMHKEDKEKIKKEKYDQIEIVDAKVMTEAEAIKEALLAKIKKRQGDISETQSRIENQ